MPYIKCNSVNSCRTLFFGGESESKNTVTLQIYYHALTIHKALSHCHTTHTKPHIKSPKKKGHGKNLSLSHTNAKKTQPNKRVHASACKGCCQYLLASTTPNNNNKQWETKLKEKEEKNKQKRMEIIPEKAREKKEIRADDYKH